MKLNDYQNEAKRTAPRDPKAYPTALQKIFDDYWYFDGVAMFDRMTWALGLTGEAGEVADLLKKGYGHGHGVDTEKLKKELGDVLWYLAVLADAFGMTLEDVARANVEKLRARYPAGFTVEASKNRGPDDV